VHRIGRTARLGAEGDAISFACDMYAMSLPDIEAYIEQKIPTASVTAELLAPVPVIERPSTPTPPAADDADNDEPAQTGATNPAARRRRRRR
jgi:ATP-dependent RNA helicase RhlB